MSWRNRLKDLVRELEGKKTTAPSLEQARLQVSLFISERVLPTFRKLAEELQKLDRSVEIDHGKDWASIRVLRNGEEEFSYGIRGRMYHASAFAFPAMGKNEEPRVLRAELSVAGGKEERDMTDLTEAEILEDFLRAYRKWTGWSQ